MTDNTPTTEQLVRSAVAGDADALTKLLQKFGPEVERSLQINPVWQTVLEPADVMQVTYLEAFLRSNPELETRIEVEGLLQSMAGPGPVKDEN